MKSTKQIVILSPGFAKDEADENCIPPLQIYLKTHQQIHPDIRIHVIAFQYPFEEKQYGWNNLEVYSAGGKNKKGLYRLVAWWKVFRQFRKIYSKNKNTVIHCFWLTECYFLGILFSKLYQLPLVATVMGQDARKTNRYLSFLKFTKTKIICCSDFSSKVLKEVHGLNCAEVIPFGVDPSESIAKVQEPRSIDVLGVGNLGPVKRFDVFLRIIAAAKKEFPTISCEIIGEGELHKMLEQQIEKSDLKKNVLMLGNLPRKQVLSKMRCSKILLHTSDYEGQCYVYLEALAAGANVLALNRGYLPQSEKVIVCESESELCEALSKLLGKDLAFDSAMPYTMNMTVQNYQTYYGI